MKLTNRVMMFCQEYIIDCNGKEAAIRAGYAKKHADKQAYRLLQDDDVKAYLGEIMKTKTDKLIASQDEVLKYLTAVMRKDELEERMITNELGQLSKTQIANQTNQLKAAELLGKRWGIFNDKVNITGAIPVVISGEDKLDD